MKFLLKLFKKETLWRALLDKEGFELVDEIEARSVWGSVFNRVPELKSFLKRREVLLLKSSTLKEKPPEFVLGQIAENRLWQAFDVKKSAELKVDLEKVEKKIIPRENFLARWKNENANTGKTENVQGEGVPRSEAQPPEGSGQNPKKEGG